MINSDDKINIHISHRDSAIQTFHRLIAKLVVKYAPSNGRVIDIGCGLGQCLHIVNKLNPTLSLYGADISQDCLRITRERTEKVNCILMEESSSDLKKLGIDYDCCIMSHTLEHMVSPLHTLINSMSLIKPGGHLIVAVPNPVRPEVIIKSILQKTYVNLGHVYSWDRSHWINFLERIAKLTVVEHCSDEVRIFPGRISKNIYLLKSIEIMLSHIIPWLSFSNISVVKKQEIDL